ncbi:hypothetical protein F4679DRAFT_553884 [Xylaria curta]|nr:hypothetical protein F4679DRAFT_553884 [Xylaria curta]
MLFSSVFSVIIFTQYIYSISLLCIVRHWGFDSLVGYCFSLVSLFSFYYLCYLFVHFFFFFFFSRCFLVPVWLESHSSSSSTTSPKLCSKDKTYRCMLCVV